MKAFNDFVIKWANRLNTISGILLALMILLTVTDLIMRSFKNPIVGTYEIVSIMAAIIIALCIPISTWLKAHIRMDFFVSFLPKRGNKMFFVVTRCMGIGLFLVCGYNLFLLGREISISGEVTPTRHIPYYPVIYMMGVSCFFQCFILYSQIVKKLKNEYE